MSEKHGCGSPKTTEYQAWQTMKHRCYNTKNTHYHDYGGRGITVCDEWKDSFVSFKKDMGLKPSKKHSLERIDNDKGYYKENCCWDLMKAQGKNRRNTLMLEIDSKEVKVLDLFEVGTKEYKRFYNRLRRGWPLEEALNRPPQLRRQSV